MIINFKLVQNKKYLAHFCCSVTSVYTLGFREQISSEEQKRLEVSGADVVKADRGGLTTFHGPGQLVAYPVFNLKQFRNMTLRNYVNLLELTAINTCRMLGVCAVHGQGGVAHTGAWVGDNKICAIGNNNNNWFISIFYAFENNQNIHYFSHYSLF